LPAASSRFGQYRSPTQDRFDGVARESRLVAMRDGTELAVDLFRPTAGGSAVEEPLPAIWTHTRYQRASIAQNGSVLTTVENWDDWLFPVIRSGYVVATVDVRGAGASFGINTGQYSAEETRDAYDMTEWLAAQPWCDGKVAMYGRSYLGITQYFAAATQPPHLVTIFPEMASFDHYDYAYGGGVFRDSSRFLWQLFCGNLDQSMPMMWKGEYQGPVSPVDGEDGPALLEAAKREHRGNLDWYRMLRAVPHRDSTDPASGETLHTTRSPNSRRDDIAAGGLPIYHLAGWYDMFPRDTLLWWANLPNPQKVVIGPWFHVDKQGLDYTAEHLRWYDHWMKGVETGVMEEDAIHYWMLDAPEGETWRSTPVWPPADTVPTAFHFHAGPSQTVASANDGGLDRAAPDGNSTDAYTVDPDATTGETNRWANANGGPSGYPDMAANDARGLTYTSAPLEADMEVIGHPVVYLWVSSDRPDGAFYAYLEEVHPDGFSQYVTEGVLLASHRKLAEPDWNNLGLPWHSGLAADCEPMDGEPVELAFDLHPTAKRFRQGHHIRVTVTCADRDNDRVPLYDPPARVRLYRDKQHPSRIILPVVSNMQS
jgi:putative CocE/NonD family hydrolase